MEEVFVTSPEYQVPFAWSLRPVFPLPGAPVVASGDFITVTSNISRSEPPPRLERLVSPNGQWQGEPPWGQPFVTIHQVASSGAANFCEASATTCRGVWSLRGRFPGRDEPLTEQNAL